MRRRGAVQKEKENNFSNSIDDLFDNVHSTNQATNPVDREFLSCQRTKGREGCMLVVDQLLTEKEVRSRIRKQEEEFRREKACKEAHRVRCTHISDESESEEVDDGKLLMDFTGNDYVDRLPIIVTGFGVQQLLGVPKIGSGTGLNQATAVMAALKEWVSASAWRLFHSILRLLTQAT